MHAPYSTNTYPTNCKTRRSKGSRRYFRTRTALSLGDSSPCNVRVKENRTHCFRLSSHDCRPADTHLQQKDHIWSSRRRLHIKPFRCAATNIRGTLSRRFTVNDYHQNFSHINDEWEFNINRRTVHTDGNYAGNNISSFRLRDPRAWSKRPRFHGERRGWWHWNKGRYFRDIR